MLRKRVFIMEGPSSKEANIINSSNAGENNMDTFNHPAPPPPYQQPNSYPQPTHSHTNLPQQMHQQGPGVFYGPGVTVTQQPGYRGPMTTTLVGGGTNTIVVMESTIGSLPSTVQCRACRQHILTRVEHQPSGRTHIAALLLCLFGCWPCVCLPYCMSSCMTSHHFCTNCGAYVGAF